jgi:uncharacterized protein YbjT (DUF2867 family)
MILVTGAAGKTGLAVIRALRKRSVPIRAFVHRPEQVDGVLEVGAHEAVAGDLTDPAHVSEAMSSVRSVYHICPNVSPDEFTIGKIAIESARRNDISHFVYHSVFHPHVESMPHHWLKMRVEETIFESRLNFTIVQPAPYMQNIMANWRSIVEEGIYPIPYSPNTRIRMVDLEDVAEAAAIILGNERHSGAIYELCGPQLYSQKDVAHLLSLKLHKQISIRQIGPAEWKYQAKERGLGTYQIDALIKMFHYYMEYGYIGNPNILTWLLGRPGTDFSTFLERI